MLQDHEAHKVEERWDDDKYRAEADFRNVGSDIANAPDDAAQWAGRRVQDVEDIPQDFDNCSYPLFHFAAMSYLSLTGGSKLSLSAFNIGFLAQFLYKDNGTRNVVTLSNSSRRERPTRIPR